MKIDVSFDFAKVYNVDVNIDVVKGQKFTLNSDILPPDITHWLSDNDPVLSMVQNGNNAVVSADNLGVSEIQIQNSDRKILKILTISVVATISPVVTDLGLSADTPISK